ncbi:oligogalacturonate-specific porin KdgM family protein [Vibrio rumoiensis]|uniref:oligogalacturonate-specific porin KdgM family protein n=1 Tax=Vibrio rumoiensis TaxID=76258 RepID=UPI00157243D3|nr:oligogalacturonate-specific porin KdgM family protein [Vibrio rumoiensis]
MKKVFLITSAIMLASTAVNATAASLDYRHEYKFGTNQNADRIKIGGSTKTETGQHNYSVEMKFFGKTGNYAYNELERGDSEFVYSYKYNINEHWYIEPGMPITFGEDKTTYKPQVRVGYAFDSGIVAKLRYRHEFQDYTENKNNGDTWQKGKITANLDYTWNNMIQMTFEANYEISYEDEYKLWDDGKTGYDYDLKLGWKNSSNWRPYVQFGNVGVSSRTDQRQLRSRVGIVYSF